MPWIGRIGYEKIVASSCLAKTVQLKQGVSLRCQMITGVYPISSLEIMTSTSAYLEQGYEKILRYCSNEFRQVGRDSQIEVNAIMREAVQRLRKRPELLT